ncbi:CIR protein PIR protein [Plasmodium vinckei brucechwatti]|uniref:CIR protein PIR protein n=1 Tax=Plasmodium vinckei brucechwatti TaxID=119398 RepID=A0A6V7RU33_PLAVN|nr:CIR protein PIR protein [Plasmodium vinckei brucechwatti]
MDHELMCEKFIAADTFYDGKNANITFDEISKKPGFKEYCRNQTCNTRKEIIGALGAYLFMETRRIKSFGQYDEFFLMWLSDKLFEIVNDENKAQSKDITLNEAHDKYLKNNIQNWHYWSLLDSTKGLKEANIKYMRDFYKLLNHICSTILDYKNNGAESTNLIRNSTNCSNQYILIYKNIHKCKSYLHLLDNLKKIYYSFRDSVISENKKKKKKLAIPLQTLTTPRGKDEYFANDFKTFDFSSSECKPKKAKKPDSSKKIEQPPLPLPLKETGPPPPLQPSNPPKDNQDEKPPAQQNPTSSQSIDELQKTKTGELSHQNGSEDSKSKQHDSENSKGTTGDTPGNKGNPNSENRSSEGGSDSGSSGGPSGDAGGTGNNQGDTGSGTVGGSDNGPGAGLGSVQGGASGGSGINHKDTNDGTGNQGSIDSGSGSQKGTGNGTGDGAKGSGDQDATNSSGTFYGYWSSNWGSRFNPLNYLPSSSEVYETQKSILMSASNKISVAYNSAVTTVKDTYDITMTAVKDTYDSAVIAVKDTYNIAVTNINYAYTTSTNYISGAISNITNQLRSLDSFYQLSDDQPELGGPGNSLPTDNNPPSTTQTPNPDPNSPPQSQSPSVTSPLSQIPSQPSSNQAQDPSKDQFSPKQPSSTHESKDTLQNGASNIVQQPGPNTGAGRVQTLPITQVTLPNSITDPSSTWNGSTIGTIVKMSEKSSIWCIASNKKCDILGIGIIGISIFVFLAIMYKYISFGSAKNSKKKKNMKRVIKYGDRTRKTQIIIKPYDRNKHLKPIINSVGRKKDPTLNIYKLMQADPVPFINLFFLLIFFVYKNKLNYLELSI